jgi:hypothetical protein
MDNQMLEEHSPDNFDIEKIEQAIRMILDAIGEDPQREGLADTPRRIAEMYAEIFAGIDRDPKKELRVGFDEGHHEMVIFKDIPFYSVCLAVGDRMFSDVEEALVHKHRQIGRDRVWCRACGTRFNQNSVVIAIQQQFIEQQMRKLSPDIPRT